MSGFNSLVSSDARSCRLDAQIIYYNLEMIGTYNAKRRKDYFKVLDGPVVKDKFSSFLSTPTACLGMQTPLAVVFQMQRPCG